VEAVSGRRAACRRPRRRASLGFSLVEAIVAATILLFVLLVLYQILWKSIDAYRLGEGNADAQQRTRVAFDLVLGELRMAGFDFDRDGEDTEYFQSSD
jgi:Tfp pilus assembly protein PilW